MQADFDIDAALTDAPLRTDLKPSLKNCIRIDIDKATPHQVKAELLRLDQILHRQRTTHTRAEVVHRAKKYAEDPVFRQHELDRRKQNHTKAKATHNFARSECLQ